MGFPAGEICGIATARKTSEILGQIDSHLLYHIVREILWKLCELDFRQESITLNCVMNSHEGASIAQAQGQAKHFRNKHAESVVDERQAVASLM
jgi:hypothetical protein